ncbi:hypothetical protein F4819DRAFT_234490 [Hypoxylon fuscum]|nr:hypothetical protein F4819DRAFT_234490 [Hypoxylon fuscum]
MSYTNSDSIDIDRQISIAFNEIIPTEGREWDSLSDELDVLRDFVAKVRGSPHLEAIATPVEFNRVCESIKTLRGNINGMLLRGILQTEMPRSEAEKKVQRDIASGGKEPASLEELAEYLKDSVFITLPQTVRWHVLQLPEVLDFYAIYENQMAQLNWPYLAPPTPLAVQHFHFKTTDPDSFSPRAVAKQIETDTFTINWPVLSFASKLLTRLELDDCKLVPWTRLALPIDHEEALRRCAIVLRIFNYIRSQGGLGFLKSLQRNE